MNLEITLDGITRNYDLDEDTVDNNDWNAIIADMMDTVEKVEEIPMFAGTNEALKRLSI